MLAKIPLPQMIAIVVLLAGVAGFFGWKQMYTPAVEQNTAATAQLQTSQDSLASAKAELERVQGQGPDFADISKASVANTAVPAKTQEVLAASEITEFANVTGVVIRSVTPQPAGSSGGGATGATTSGPRGIDFTIEGFAEYRDLQAFLAKVESSVQVRDSKLYAKGRLYNTQSVSVSIVEIPEADELDSGPVDPLEVPADGVQRVEFTVVVRAYTRSSDQAEAAAAGAAAPVAGGAPAAGGAPTTGAPTGAPTAGGAPTTQPATPTTTTPAGTS